MAANTAATRLHSMSMVTAFSLVNPTPNMPQRLEVWPVIPITIETEQLGHNDMVVGDQVKIYIYTYRYMIMLILLGMLSRMVC